MKKISTILITIVIWLVFLILIGRFTSSFVDPIGMPIFNYEFSSIHSNLIDLGHFLLAIVFVVMTILRIAIILVLIPYLSYCIVKLDFDRIKKLKLLGIPTAIIIGAICLLSIAGVQLRSIKFFTADPTEVRVVDPSFVRIKEFNGKPKKYLEDHFFYYNDSIKDWVLTSKIDYVKKKQKPSHLLYSVKSETKKYRKSTLGNWLEVNDMGFNAAKSAGLQTLEYIPKPCVNYFLFTSNDWKKITKDEFFKYRDLDSIVRYE
jgi:hypothetical protein